MVHIRNHLTQSVEVQLIDFRTKTQEMINHKVSTEECKKDLAKKVNYNEYDIMRRKMKDL